MKLVSITLVILGVLLVVASISKKEVGGWKIMLCLWLIGGSFIWLGFVLLR